MVITPIGRVANDKDMEGVRSPDETRKGMTTKKTRRIQISNGIKEK